MICISNHQDALKVLKKKYKKKKNLTVTNVLKCTPLEGWKQPCTWPEGKIERESRSRKKEGRKFRCSVARRGMSVCVSGYTCHRTWGLFLINHHTAMNY